MISMKDKILYGKVTKGSISFYDIYEFNKYIATLDGEVEIIIRPLQPRKSSAQDAYYRGVVLKIFADHTGYTKQEMHAVCKKQFDITSTKDLSKYEYSDYITRVKRWASIDFDCIIPNAHTE